MSKKNPMRQISIEKVVINIGCGDDKNRLERAEKLLKRISTQKPVITKTHKRTLFGMSKKKPVGVKLTLRGKKAENFLKDIFEAVEHKIKKSQISGNNFSIGIKEYIDIPKMEYDPDIGIIGMDVCVVLKRPGFNITKRRIKKSKIGENHKISKNQSAEWLEKNFKVKIIE